MDIAHSCGLHLSYSNPIILHATEHNLVKAKYHKVINLLTKDLHLPDRNNDEINSVVHRCYDMGLGLARITTKHKLVCI